MFKRLLGPFLALLALLAMLGYSHYLVHQAGIQKGVDTYHDLCYHNGGYIVDEKKGTVVVCKGLTQLPEQELQNFLDKPSKMV